MSSTISLRTCHLSIYFITDMVVSSRIYNSGSHFNDLHLEPESLHPYSFFFSRICIFTFYRYQLSLSRLKLSNGDWFCQHISKVITGMYLYKLNSALRDFQPNQIELNIYVLSLFRLIAL